MTTNAPEQARTTSADDLESPSRLRQAVTTVRTSRPAQAAAAHRKPVTAGLLAVTGAATAVLLLLRRKRNAKPVRSSRLPTFRRR
ncbi:hypothetical protein Acy02nite_84270 [Actinoplanes cyaneus]|uniref:Uncharacterized protein n=1 Tax=Actinoplanes cyaneus TaxID=52696 RepID=A0A919ISP7_9ACTN|nr:hypothetical protein [Actinoplanes cyaneus]MCW2143822.1 hypothetical protein [Actinoplanes cyaneus]GID70546.1 hypothetical protein Acy02nite_84270 [Actinoplanes cyaneus]